MDAISLSLYPIIIRDRIFLSRGVFDLSNCSKSILDMQLSM